MIRISFRYDSKKRPTGFTCSGHAGFADYGEDIVCSAITALVFNAVNSIDQFTSDTFQLETDEETGYISCLLDNEPSDDAILLLRSLELGVSGISQEYGNEYVSLFDWEV